MTDSDFEQLYITHRQRVYSICLRMLKNQAEAEDLTQDVFIQVHRKIDTFRGDSAITTWLHRLTVNQVLMHFRKSSVRMEKASEDEFPDLPVLGTDNPRRMRIVDKIALDKAIAALPAGYKNVFVLKELQGFEHEEAARILGVSVGTTKSQLAKAKRKLQKLLNKRANPRLYMRPQLESAGFSV